MAALPGVSVVIPTYNRADVLGEALESVFAQGHADLEVVVVDDGSTDATRALLDDYRARYRDSLTVIRQANAGESAARNAGILAARHDLVALLDSDNRWHPDKLRNQLPLHADDRSLTFSFTGYTTFGDVAPDTIVLEHWDPEPAAALEELLVGCCINTSTVIAAKQMLVDAGLFDTSLRCCQDHDLWLRAAAMGRRIGYVPEALLEYRVHAHGTSYDEALVAASTERVFGRLFAERALPEPFQARERFYMSRCYLNGACRYLQARDGKRATSSLVHALVTRPLSFRPGWIWLLLRGLALRLRSGGPGTEAA
jgi:glycosyltransferase involved in cell wall biosynthesis